MSPPPDHSSRSDRYVCTCPNVAMAPECCGGCSTEGRVDPTGHRTPAFRCVFFHPVMLRGQGSSEIRDLATSPCHDPTPLLKGPGPCIVMSFIALARRAVFDRPGRREHAMWLVIRGCLGRVVDSHCVTSTITGRARPSLTLPFHCFLNTTPNGSQRCVQRFSCSYSLDQSEFSYDMNVT